MVHAWRWNCMFSVFLKPHCCVSVKLYSFPGLKFWVCASGFRIFDSSFFSGPVCHFGTCPQNRPCVPRSGTRWQSTLYLIYCIHFYFRTYTTALHCCVFAGAHGKPEVIVTFISATRTNVPQITKSENDTLALTVWTILHGLS